MLRIKHEPECTIIDVIEQSADDDEHSQSVASAFSVPKSTTKVYKFNKNLSCDICERKYSLKTSLKYHMRIHKKGGTNANKEGDKEICELCKKSVKILSIHVDNCHSGMMTFLIKLLIGLRFVSSFPRHRLQLQHVRLLDQI